MPRPSLREALVDEGMKVLVARGYTGAGVAEITAAANAPKGSFYNHFASKEAFAAEALEDYFQGFAPLFAATVLNDGLTGLERLTRLSDGLAAALRENGFQGCLIGILALDAGAETETLTRRVNAKFEAFREALAGAFAAGQSDGTVSSQLAADVGADVYLSMFEGAALRAKAQGDGAPLDAFCRAVETLFRA